MGFRHSTQFVFWGKFLIMISSASFSPVNHVNIGASEKKREEETGGQTTSLFELKPDAKLRNKLLDSVSKREGAAGKKGVGVDNADQDKDKSKGMGIGDLLKLLFAGLVDIFGGVVNAILSGKNILTAIKDALAKLFNSFSVKKLPDGTWRLSLFGIDVDLSGPYGKGKSFNIFGHKFHIDIHPDDGNADTNDKNAADKGDQLFFKGSSDGNFSAAA